MDNFDNIFANRLQQEQEFDFRESDWQEVADRLEPAPVVAPTAFNWKVWAAAAILLSLLGGIAWLAIELKDARNTIQNLKNQPVAENLRVDTIYKEVAVVRVDTIFKTQTIATTVPTKYFITTPLFANNQRFNTHDISVTGTGMLGTSFFSPFFERDGTRRTAYGARTERTNYSVKKEEFTVSADVEKLAILEGEELILPQTKLNIKEVSTSDLTLNSKPKFKDYLRPIGSKIGVTAGKSFITAGDLTNVSSSNVGLKGELQFVQNVSLTGGVDWYNVSYQTTEFSNLGREIPMPDLEDLGSANPSDLTFAALSESFTQYKIGLKYAFPTKTTATPYIGINYLASSNFKKDFYYFFDIPPAQGLDVELTANNSYRRFNSDGFGLDLGVELSSQKWLSFQIEGYYHFITPEMRSQYYDLVGIRLAALVNFKK